MDSLAANEVGGDSRGALRFVDGLPFQLVVACVICANAAFVTVDSYGLVSAWLPGIPDAAQLIDYLFVGFFCCEMALKIVAHRGQFFRNAWNIFDLVVILPSLVPALGVLSVARIFRVIRLLRLVSMFRSFRDLTTAMIRSVADAIGMCGIIVCLNFVFAAVGHAALKDVDPAHFGDIGVAMYTMFRSFTFMEANAVVDALPGDKLFAGVFMFSYFFVMTYLILSFFIAIATFYMYSVMQERYDAQADEGKELDSLRQDLAEVKAMLRDLAAADNRH
jgi:voltage-gated sodium channel